MAPEKDSEGPCKGPAGKPRAQALGKDERITISPVRAKQAAPPLQGLGPRVPITQGLRPGLSCRTPSGFKPLSLVR
jgi:hypothetical protein